MLKQIFTAVLKLEPTKLQKQGFLDDTSKTIYREYQVCGTNSQTVLTAW